MQEILLNLSLSFGLAYWVKIDTNNPLCTYYFGPFLKLKEAERSRLGYIEDLKEEGASEITVTIGNFKPQELTICDDLVEILDPKVWPIFGS